MLASTTGLITLLFYTFNPYIFFYSRSFQPESTMLFFTITMLYFFSEWIDREGWWRFALMTLCATLAFLVKLPYDLFRIAFVVSLSRENTNSIF